MHVLDAVPEQTPVFGQKPLTSQIPPVAHGMPGTQEMAPWQVCDPKVQFAFVVQAPPVLIGPHGIPPVIEPLLWSTHAVGPLV
jgi:hypothetical protein